MYGLEHVKGWIMELVSLVCVCVWWGMEGKYKGSVVWKVWKEVVNFILILFPHSLSNLNTMRSHCRS